MGENTLSFVPTFAVLLSLAFAFALRPYASRRQESWFVQLLVLLCAHSAAPLIQAPLADSLVLCARLLLLVAAMFVEAAGLGVLNRQHLAELPHNRRVLVITALALMVAATLAYALAPHAGMAPSIANASLVLAYAQLPCADIYTDPKTLSLTREGMQDVIAWRLRRGKVAVLAVAIDRYEDLRMLNGEEEMSKALKLVALCLAELSCFSDVAYLGRGRFLVVGGEDFDVEAARTTIMRRFQEPWQVSNVPLMMSASFAVLPATDSIPTAREVLATMDVAMDEAVLTNAGQAITVNDHVQESFDEHTRVRRVLERAVAHNAVEVWFQPLYATKEQRVIGAEALARLRDDDGRYISPSVFIAVAERAGIIDCLGEQIFKKVCDFVSSTNMDELGITFINVNLSPYQCLSEALPERLSAIATRSGISMDFFHLEVTESAMVDVGILREQMSLLVTNGSEFALDDYGTGYSNLRRIVSLPFANVKLDHSIVWDYFEGKSLFLPSLVSAFHDQGLEVTAEGVETEDMVHGLERMGCDLLQGFYFSRALPSDDFVAYVQGQRLCADRTANVLQSA